MKFPFLAPALLRRKGLAQNIASDLPGCVERDRAELMSIFDGFESLRSQAALVSSAEIARQGYLSPEQADLARGALLTFRNLRLALYPIVWRHAHYATVSDPAERRRSFLTGYAGALLIYSHSLEYATACDANPALRNKLNEPEPVFDIPEAFFDSLADTFFSLRYLALFAAADSFWRSSRSEILAENADETGKYLAASVKRNRAKAWRGFWPALRLRAAREGRSFAKLLFAPAKIAGYSGQFLLGNALGNLTFAPGRPCSVTPDLMAWLAPKLRPGDALFTRTDWKATTALLPGYFAHAALFLGGLAERGAVQSLLDQAKAANPAIAPCARLPETALGWVVDAKSQGCAVRSLEETLCCDHVLALRGPFGPAQAQSALSRALLHLGKPYDFDFDFSTDGKMVCTELAAKAYRDLPGCSFVPPKRLGRRAITADELCLQMLLRGSASEPLWNPAAFLRPCEKSCAAIEPGFARHWLLQRLSGKNPACAAPAQHQPPI